MKICGYCTEKNRDEAIFCRRCKRPLRSSPIPRDYSLIWLGVMFLCMGVSSYYFLSDASAASTQPPGGTPASLATGTPEAAFTFIPEPVTVKACVWDSTVHIRRGPTTEAETTGGLAPGTCLTIVGRNQEASWVYMVSDDHQAGWVAASVIDAAGNLSQVSVRDPSALTSSTRPTLTSAEIAHGAQVYLTNIAQTNVPQSPLTRYVVPCFETVSQVGSDISCRIEKANCDFLPGLEGSPTFCYDLPAPDHTFALIAFGQDWSDYDGQCLIVSGHLGIDRGVLQVQAEDRSQVSLCH